MRKKYFLLVLIAQLGFAQAPAIQWQKCFGGIGFDEAYSIVQTTDGGYVVAGSTNLNGGDVTGNHGLTDFWVVKVSSIGILQWKKCYGGSADDKAYCIQQTTDGGYIVAGSTVSTDGDVTGLHLNSFNPLWGDYWVIKIDSIGTLQWQKTIGGTSADQAHSIIQTTDGGYIVVGESYADHSWDGDFVNAANIVKLSSTGAIEWVTYGGDYNYSVKQTTDGGYIVVGWLTGKFNVLKLDSMGVQQWQKFYGGSAGSDFAKSVIQTSDGGYMVAGYTQSSDGNVTGFHGGTNDAWLVKLDSAGNLQWQKTLGGSYNDEAYSIQQTADDGYIIAGQTNSNDGDVNGLHGAAGAINCCAPITDYWVVKITNAGVIQWQKTMGGSYIDTATSIIKTSDGGYVVAGHTANNIVNSGDVTGFHLNTSVPNASGYDYWIVKLAPDALGIAAFASNQITVFPNPTASVITVQNNANLVLDTIIVTDLTGKTVLLQTQNSNQINVEQLASGMYILRGFSGEEQYVSKFVKE